MMLTNQERQQIYARHFKQYSARHCSALFNTEEIIEGCATEARDEQLGRILVAVSYVGGWALMLGSCVAFWWYVVTLVSGLIR